MIKIPNFTEDLLQPAGLDCPIGAKAYRMPSAGVPRETETIEEMLRGRRYEFDLRDTPEGGTFLERGVCHIIPLDVFLELGNKYYAEFSPKSTVGRNDVFVRVLTDYWRRYDVTQRGYSGRLYLEVTPLSYSIRVRPGLSLTQMRVKTEEKFLSNEELQRLHAEHGIVRDAEGKALPHASLEVRQESLFFHVDLSTSVVGLEALECPEEEASLALRERYEPADFWSPLRARSSGGAVLMPGRFYLLRTRERIVIPPHVCGWMQPYDVASGEFRSHYAGFFDNGFGGKSGTVGVLEVRVRDVPWRILDGQPICRFVFERTDEMPEKIYGRDVGSYTESGPSLGKNFTARYEAWETEYWRKRW